MKISNLIGKIEVKDSSKFFEYSKKWIDYVISKKKSIDISDVEWATFFGRNNPAAGVDWGELLDEVGTRNGKRKTNEKKSFKDKWDSDIRPSIEDAINTKDISEKLRKIKAIHKNIQFIIKNGGGRDRTTAINRMLTIFFPDSFVTIPNPSKLIEFIDILKNRIENGDTIIKVENWVDNSYEVRKFFDRELDNDDLTESAWRFYDYLKENQNINIHTDTTTNMSNSNYDEFIKLLKCNYNLILTGAPGTGKTYMARAIAEKMGAEWELVQFHPSYDYTDFVEGLRPIKEGETLGFQRKDGVFKEFCKEAIKNLEDSNKTKDELEEERSFTDKYNELIDKIEEGEINELELRTGVKMKIVKVSDFNNIILRSLETDSERTYTVSFDRLMKLAKAFPSARSFNRISNISEEIRNVIGGCNASAYWAVLNELYKYERNDISYIANVPDRMTATYVAQSPNVVRRKPFVFIIDEINRGEISKIFGELFFSIDAGYRGEKGRVETQYQNLVPEEDVFSKGFYIPENVYIIGTMNDIDRSVESMDFAMRRRFAWKEITAKSRQSMLDDDEAWGANGKPSDSVIAEMKNRMDNLNAAIIDQYGEEEYSNKDRIGLSKAYQIGAAYFLKYALYNNFEELWTNHLEGLLYEYLRGKTNVEEKIERLHQAYNDTTKY